MIDNKPELRYCKGNCNCYTPHIIIIRKEKKYKFCLVCCKTTSFNEKQDMSLLEPTCEYCIATLNFIDGNHKGTNGRRFCRNGRCATNQNKFIKAWRDSTVTKINKKIKDLRNRIQVNKLYQTSTFNDGIGFTAIARRNPKLEQDKIGIIHNQIAILYNIKESKIMVMQEIKTWCQRQNNS